MMLHLLPKTRLRFLRLLACGELLWSDLGLSVVGIEKATNSAALPAGVGHEDAALQTHSIPGPILTPGVLVKTTWVRQNKS